MGDKIDMYHFLTQDLYDRLLANGKEQQALSERDEWKDHVPVVLLFLPGTGCRWLLTEVNPDDPKIAFGLCDLGMGFPEQGSVSLEELADLRNPFGQKVEREKSFRTDRTLGDLTDLAQQYRRIVLPQEINLPGNDRGR